MNFLTNLFKTKRQHFLELANESLDEANKFSKKERKKIAEEIILWMKMCERKDIDTLKEIGQEAMRERQLEITEMGEKNPNWVRACLVESYIAAKILGQTKSMQVLINILLFVKACAPKAYKKNFGEAIFPK